MNQQDKQFMTQFSIVLGALVVFTIVMFFFARYLMSANPVDYGPLMAKEIQHRIEPVGVSKMEEVVEVATAAPEGKSTFQAMCSTCHSSGALGAPMITDKAAWQARLTQGPKVLYSSAINGIGSMPAKGGHPQLSDDQVKAAVNYIMSQVSGGKTAEGAQPKPQTGTSIKQAAIQGMSPEGKSTFQAMCSTCHISGALGAPMIADKAAWQARVTQGTEVLYSSAINGIGAMPAKGGHPQLSDDQVKAAVDYIVSRVSKAGESVVTAGEATDTAVDAVVSALTLGAAGKGAKSAAAQAGTSIKQAAAQGASPESESTYQAMCSTCHSSGALGAPMITDKAAWQARITQGPKVLYSSAINGIGAMPAKGGHPQLSDDQVKAAVDYIISEVSASGGEIQKPAKSSSEQPAQSSAKSEPKAAADKSKQTQAGAMQSASLAGKSTYEAMCSTCHDAGVLGAPKLGDKAAWQPRIAQGKQVLYSSATNGIGNMPAKGGHPQLNDEQIKAAVDYMVGAAK